MSPLRYLSMTVICSTLAFPSVGLTQVAPDRPPCINNATGPQCPFEPGSHKAQPEDSHPDTKPLRGSGRKDGSPDMKGREGVPPSAGSGARAVDGTMKTIKDLGIFL